MAWGIMLISVRTRDVRLGRVELARNSFSRLGWVGQTSLTRGSNVGSRTPSSWSRHLSPNVSTSVRIFGSAEVGHTTMGTLSGL